VSNADEAYKELIRQARETANLASIGALLSWDQETMMPVRAAAFRAEQLSLVARLAHERATDPRLGELLDRCDADSELTSDPPVAANLREMRRDYARLTLLPSELVAEISETSSRALEVWKVARRDNDFQAMLPWLEKQFELARRKAECYGAPKGGELYDALLEDYEPQMTGKELERIFEPLRVGLTQLITSIGAARHRPDDAPDSCRVPIDRQRRFSERILDRIGFERSAGRLDVSTHPFSTGIAPGDTRITTRYGETRFADALGSTMHEAGHAMYEQGLPRDRHFGEPLGESLSLGYHESQSRLWENHVGRSRAFWQWALPVAAKELGSGLERFSVDEVYEAVNAVRPSLIRVESDELTYNLHIMLRFDIERALLRGELAVRELPEAWNCRMLDDLGVKVPDDTRGCLQDIHWAMGSIGYFPTYTLGNLYAAQIWETITRALPDLDEQMSRGEFGPLLGWLREQIHAHGRCYRAAELCVRVTGKPLGHEPLMRHLDSKLRPIYRLDDNPASVG